MFFLSRNIKRLDRGPNVQQTVVHFLAVTRFCLLSQSYKPFLDPTQPPTHCLTWGKWPGHKADHSFPFGIEIENESSHTSIYLYTWHKQGQIYFCCKSEYSSAVLKVRGKCIPIGKSQFENSTVGLLG